MRRSAGHPRTRKAAAIAAAVAGSFFLLAGSCDTVRPSIKPATDVPSTGRFPHARLSLLLEKIVSNEGLVDYGALSVEVTLLEEYLGELARVSPDSHPHLFPTENDQLAYWINAHNACALRGVLRLNRPASLKDIARQFDWGTSYILGGKELSLGNITNLIRKHFPEPRVHFVLVRARRGGPPLSKAAYEPADLEDRMEAAAKAFMADERNVQWTSPSREVKLSQLLLFYRGDLERQMSSTVSGDVRLIEELNRWRPVRQRIVATTIVPIPFDERLNDVANR
jgi:hypothetical protein